MKGGCGVGPHCEIGDLTAIAGQKMWGHVSTPLCGWALHLCKKKIYIKTIVLTLV